MAAGSEKREVIKAEALRLFAQRGVDAVSVRDIGAACQMNTSNLYAHFRSKEDVVAALYQEGYAAYGALVADAVSGPGAFRPRLERVIRLICQLHDEDNLRFRFLVMSQHGHLREVSRDERNPVEVIARAVAAGMEAGDIPRRDPELMAAAIVGLIVQPATFLLYGRLEGDLGSRADELVAMCWRVLS